MPELRPTARLPHFSKSAPNLDKSRTAATLPASSTSRNILGKSHEVLNRITNDDNMREEDEENFDDDDEVEVKGCFGFINKNDENNSTQNNKIYHKKYSLDSKIKESNYELISTGGEHVSYDPIFYRTLQKSLDDLFSRDDDLNEVFGGGSSSIQSSFDDSHLHRRQSRTERVSSKSSGDLSMYGTEEDSETNYRFQKFASDSKFRREHFFTNQSKSLDLTDRDSNSTIKERYSNLVTEFTEAPLEESMSSLNISTESKNKNCSKNLSFEEKSNSFCSDNSSIEIKTPSRKSSVTFKNDIEINSPENSSSSSHLFYTNNYPIAISKKNDFTRKFTISTNYTDLVKNSKELPKSRSKNKIDKQLNKKTKTFNFTKMFRKKVVKTKSFYNKNYDPTNVDMKESLLAETAEPTNDVANQNSSVQEPQYGAIFYTTNFVLARQNEI